MAELAASDKIITDIFIEFGDNIGMFLAHRPQPSGSGLGGAEMEEVWEHGSFL